jgi:hypothetical protein
MAKDENEEWRTLRKQLRQGGWNVGDRVKSADGVSLQLWPAPHGGPTEGVTAWEVQGADKVAAARAALQAIADRSSPPVEAPR